MTPSMRTSFGGKFIYLCASKRNSHENTQIQYLYKSYPAASFDPRVGLKAFFDSLANLSNTESVGMMKIYLLLPAQSDYGKKTNLFPAF